MRPSRTLLAVAALLLVGACSDSPKESDVTKEDAVARVAQRAQDAEKALPPGGKLVLADSEPDVPCDDGHDRTFVENRYNVDFPKDWPVDQSMTALADYWAANGYKIVRDDRAGTQIPELVVEKEADGFRIGYLINHNPDGLVNARILSSSPCLDS
jgi:hypothetical protein